MTIHQLHKHTSHSNLRTDEFGCLFILFTGVLAYVLANKNHPPPAQVSPTCPHVLINVDFPWPHLPAIAKTCPCGISILTGNNTTSGWKLKVQSYTEITWENPGCTGLHNPELLGRTSNIKSQIKGVMSSCPSRWVIFRPKRGSGIQHRYTVYIDIRYTCQRARAGLFGNKTRIYPPGMIHIATLVATCVALVGLGPSRWITFKSSINQTHRCFPESISTTGRNQWLQWNLWSYLS